MSGLVPYLTPALICLLVFRDYLAGSATPNWDFWGGYLTNAYSWWDLGGILDPPGFLPYVLGGYPAALNLQDSSWYLPVGAIATLAEYTPHSAAVLQAVTCAVGSLGVVALAGRLLIRPPIAMLGGIGYIFTAGFFSNAQHVDIVRAWAFLPWLLYLITPPRTTIRPWQTVVSALVWWQFFVGAYPGNIAAYAYVGAAWVTVAWVFKGIRNGHPPLALLASQIGPIFAGLLLAAPKWVPYFALSESPPSFGNTVTTNPTSFLTLVFPYTSDSLANDVTMRTLYLSPLLLLFAFFAGRPSPATWFGLTLVSLGLLLGVDTNLFHGWQELLPLLDISRFRTVDFKPAVTLGLALLGMAGIQNFWESAAKSKDGLQALVFPRARVAGLALGGFLLLALVSPLSSEEMANGLTVLGISLAFLVVFWLEIRRRPSTPVSLRGPEVWTLAAGILLPGLLWSAFYTAPWSTPANPASWSGSASELIARQMPVSLLLRPERSGPVFPDSAASLLYQGWNEAEYLRSPSLGGNASLKGQPTFEEYVRRSQDPASAPLFEFLRRPSIAILDPDGESMESIQECTSASPCHEAAGATITSWSPGRVDVELAPASPAGTLVVNEVAWPGWFSTICSSQGLCVEAPVASGPDHFLMSAQIETSGARSVTFEFREPRRRLAFVAAFGGWATIIALATYVYAVRRRAASQLATPRGPRLPNQGGIG